MNISMEAKKREAVERMKLLGIYEPTIAQFADDDLVSISEPPFGAYFWVADDDKKRIKEFEQENNALVFSVIRSYTNIGKMDSYLFVGDYPEEWEIDRKDIKEGQALAYVFNHDDPQLSEMGMIAFRLGPAAGLLRTF